MIKFDTIDLINKEGLYTCDSKHEYFLLYIYIYSKCMLLIITTSNYTSKI